MRLIEMAMVLILFTLMFCSVIVFLLDVADTAIRTVRLRQKIYSIRQERIDADEQTEVQVDSSFAAGKGGLL